MNEKIVYSIITAVYNREDCVLRCLNSSLLQKYQYWEHIVVDDGSTDKTFEFVTACANTNHKIRLLLMDKNRGTNAARNHAIKNANGRYVIILDSDDYLTENALQVIDEEIGTHPGFLHYLFVHDDMSLIIQSNKLLNGKDKVLSFENWIKSEVSGDFVHIIDKEMLCKFPFNEQLKIYEGLNFMLMYRYSQEQQFINKIMVHRERNRIDSVTKDTMLINQTAIQSQFEFLKQMIMNFEKDYELYNPEALNSMISKCLMLCLALSNYTGYKYLSDRFKKKNVFTALIYRLKLGQILKMSIILYSKIKHSQSILTMNFGKDYIK